jgi:hypothetical protein
MSTDLAKLPEDLRRALAKELQTGERLLYAGMPDWRAGWGLLLALSLFGMAWSAIALLFFVHSALGLLGVSPMLSEGKPVGIGLNLFFSFFSLPFVAVGLAILTGPFFSIRKSRNTVHAITDIRLLNVYAGRDAGADSYPLSHINFIKRRDRKDKTGDLHIGYGIEKDSDGDMRPLTTEWEGIADVRRAESAIASFAPHLNSRPK